MIPCGRLANCTARRRRGAGGARFGIASALVVAACGSRTGLDVIGGPLETPIDGSSDTLSSTSSRGGSSADANPGTISGTVDGTAVPTTDIIALVGGDVLEAMSFFEVAIVISNQGSSCAILQQGLSASNWTALVVAVHSPNSVGPGIYPVDAGGAYATTATFAASDPTCTSTIEAEATSGAVTLATVTPTSIAGSIDLALTASDGTSSHVEGTFFAPVCSAPLTAIPSAAVCGL